MMDCFLFCLYRNSVLGVGLPVKAVLLIILAIISNFGLCLKLILILCY